MNCSFAVASSRSLLHRLVRCCIVSLAIASLLFGCGTSDGTPASGEVVTAHMEAITVGDASIASREITIASTPNAKCTLHSSGAAKSMSMPVWADDVGIVHLWAPQRSTSEGYSLECSEAGVNAQYRFDLADTATFVAASPRAVPTGRKIRPALTDPMSLSQADLIIAGYPPRPDPILAAPLYEKWLDMVSTPATLIPPNLVERSDLHFGPQTNITSSVWGGLVLAKSATRYTVSVGQFHVPIFAPLSPSSNTAIWSGLDGAFDSVLIQDGVDYASVGSVGTQMAWYQYYPLSAVFNTSMVVHANDSMVFWAWEGDASCLNGAGRTGYGCFYYSNQTTGVTVANIKVAAPGTFVGGSAEAIIEPQVSTALAPWYFASMQLLTVDSNNIGHNFNSDPYYDMTLVNGSGQTRATSTYISYPDGASFAWQNP